MGIYDREYYREESRGGLLSNRSMVTNLILLNVAIFLIEFVSSNSASFHLNDWLELDTDRPWEVWRLLTYGFAHAPGTIIHVGFNMLGLWMFGREMETMYGRAEFLRFYLVAIVVSGMAWFITESVVPGHNHTTLVGASGGVTAVLLLWVLHFPTRTILFNFLIPIPAWAMAAIYVFMNVVGTVNSASNSNTAHMAHLAGAAFGFLYQRNRWNLGRLLPSRPASLSLKFRPRLKLHDPEAEEQRLAQQVDRILKKVHETGEASLTKKERATLEEASRKYQQRKN